MRTPAKIDEFLIGRAISLAGVAREMHNHPYGAVLAKDGRIVFEMSDQSVQMSDPTHHPEIGVIREFCRRNKLLSLRGYALYSSAEPCPMCAGAIYYAGVSRLVYSVPRVLITKLRAGRRGSQHRRYRDCGEIINDGSNQIDIIGPLLLEEGLRVFEGYDFPPKLELQKFNKPESR